MLKICLLATTLKYLGAKLVLCPVLVMVLGCSLQIGFIRSLSPSPLSKIFFRSKKKRLFSEDSKPHGYQGRGLSWQKALKIYNFESFMVHTGLMAFYSRTFPGLLTIFKESVSTGTISHFFHSHSKKAIPVSANNVALFMCDFNADSPMFEMSIIRWQDLQKAFFLSTLNAVNQPL